MVKGKEKRASRGRVRPGCRPGFSLMEVLVVVAFMAIILMMALPSLHVLAPNYMVRSSAQGLAMLMQRARLTANNTQKPTRVVLDCREASQVTGNSFCLMMMHTANFDNTGELDSSDPWRLAPNSRREVNRMVRVAVSDVPGTPARPTPSPVYENIDGVYWAVFLPTGRVHMSHNPMRLRFSALNSDVGQREVSLNPYSGRATVRMTK